MENGIIRMWQKNGWKFKVEQGTGIEKFVYKVKIADNITRYITVNFATKSERKYYFVEVYTAVNGKETVRVNENLYIEAKEHMLIHKTLLKLGWLKEGEKENGRK